LTGRAAGQLPPLKDNAMPTSIQEFVQQLQATLTPYLLAGQRSASCGTCLLMSERPDLGATTAHRGWQPAWQSRTVPGVSFRRIISAKKRSAADTFDQQLSSSNTRVQRHDGG
jgi:hypothetical protein